MLVQAIYNGGLVPPPGRIGLSNRPYRFDKMYFLRVLGVLVVPKIRNESQYFEPQRREGRKEFFNALRAGYLLRLFTMRFMPSFINGTFQFKRKPSLRLVSFR